MHVISARAHTHTHEVCGCVYFHSDCRSSPSLNCGMHERMHGRAHVQFIIHALLLSFSKCSLCSKFEGSSATATTKKSQLYISKWWNANKNNILSWLNTQRWRFGTHQPNKYNRTNVRWLCTHKSEFYAYNLINEVAATDQFNYHKHMRDAFDGCVSVWVCVLPSPLSLTAAVVTVGWLDGGVFRFFKFYAFSWCPYKCGEIDSMRLHQSQSLRLLFFFGRFSVFINGIMFVKFSANLHCKFVWHDVRHESILLMLNMLSC